MLPFWIRRTIPVLAVLIPLLGGTAAVAGGVIKVAVSAKQPDGELCLDVAAEGFQAWLDDKPAAVRSVQTPQGSLVLLVVMDVVGDLNRVDTARKALIEALGEFGPKHYLALLQAQDGLQVIHDPTADRDAFQEALLAVSASGFPGLLESVEDAAAIGDRILRRSEVRVAILYITDGSIYQYRGDYTNPVINPSDRSDLSRRFRDRLIQERMSRTLTAVTKSWTPLFFLHLENHRDSLNVVYQNGLTQFAQTTGGEALFCDSVPQIPVFLGQLLERIRGLYTVTIETPQGFEGRTRVRLEAQPDVQIQHRQQFEISRPEPSKPEPEKSK